MSALHDGFDQFVDVLDDDLVVLAGVFYYDSASCAILDPARSREIDDRVSARSRETDDFVCARAREADDHVPVRSCEPCDDDDLGGVDLVGLPNEHILARSREPFDHVDLVGVVLVGLQQ